jgi:glycosyltransferase involved in cell wall biosynthesis
VGDVAATLGPAGVTLPASDPRAFAGVVQRLLADAPRLAALRRAGPARVRQQFRVQVLTEQLLAAYRCCCPSLET